MEIKKCVANPENLEYVQFDGTLQNALEILKWSELKEIPKSPIIRRGDIIIKTPDSSICTMTKEFFNKNYKVVEDIENIGFNSPIFPKDPELGEGGCSCHLAAPCGYCITKSEIEHWEEKTKGFPIDINEYLASKTPLEFENGVSAWCICNKRYLQGTNQFRKYGDSIRSWFVESNISHDELWSFCQKNIESTGNQNEEDWRKGEKNNCGIHFLGYAKLNKVGENLYRYTVVMPYCD